MTMLIIRCNWRLLLSFKNTTALGSAMAFASTSLSASSRLSGWSATRTLASSAAQDQTDPNAPVKFTTSKAFKVDPIFMRSETKESDAAPWFQFPIISISLLSVLVYFVILREENDIDQLLVNESTLASVFKEQEKQYLKSAIERLQKEGSDTTTLRVKLDALEHEDAAAEKLRVSSVLEKGSDK